MVEGKGFSIMGLASDGFARGAKLNLFIHHAYS